MKRLTIRSNGRTVVGVALVAAAILLMTTAPAFAQHYVPLRYDMRRGRPRYVPGREPFRGTGAYQNYGGYDAPRPDPYSYAAVQSRNLFLTGNVRGGKGFRGTTPYSQTGSQLSQSLPSLRLSDFRRDSVGIGDIGTGVEYGTPLPYTPSSAAVTTAFDTRTQSAPAYRGATSPLPPLPPAAGYGGSGSFIKPALEPDVAPSPGGDERAEDAGRPLVGEGDVEIPDSVYEFILRLAREEEGAAEDAERAADAEGLSRSDPSRLYLPKPSLSFREGPSNVFRHEGIDALLEGRFFEEEGEQDAEDDGGTLLLSPEDTASAEEDGPWVSLRSRRPGFEPDLSRQPTRVALLVRAGHAAFGGDDYDRAAELYREASVLAPSRPTPVFGYLHALLAGGRYYRAALAVERAFERRPEWARKPPNPQSVFPNEVTYDRVVRELKERLSLRPGDRRLNLVLGYVLYAAGEPDEATPYLEKAVEGEERPEKAPTVILEAIAAGGTAGTREAG